MASLSETLCHDPGLVTDQWHCSVLCPFYVPTGISESQRNRPSDLGHALPSTRSQRVAQAMIEKAVGPARVSAMDAARLTFDAVREGRFHIASHPLALDGVRVRAEDILSVRNPTDALAAHPDLRESLMDALRE